MHRAAATAELISQELVKRNAPTRLSIIRSNRGTTTAGRINAKATCEPIINFSGLMPSAIKAQAGMAVAARRATGDIRIGEKAETT